MLAKTDMHDNIVFDMFVCCCILHILLIRKNNNMYLMNWFVEWKDHGVRGMIYEYQWHILNDYNKVKPLVKDNGFL